MPFEAYQILDIPQSMHNQEDKFIWGPDKHGLFSVKSAYHFIKHCGDQERAQSSNTNQVKKVCLGCT